MVCFFDPIVVSGASQVITGPAEYFAGAVPAGTSLLSSVRAVPVCVCAE
jgi:hypothetical protein